MFICIICLKMSNSDNNLGFYILLLKNVSTYVLDDTEKEAQLRNTALIKLHKTHIPSYALWCSADIKGEQDSLKWWKNFFEDFKVSNMDEECLEWT